MLIGQNHDITMKEVLIGECKGVVSKDNGIIIYIINCCMDYSCQQTEIHGSTLNFRVHDNWSSTVYQDVAFYDLRLLIYLSGLVLH